MVGVSHGGLGDVPCLVPGHAGLVDEDAHQLGHHQCGVGVVDLDDVLLVEVLQSAVSLQVLGGDGLHGGGDEEVLLLQTQRLAFVMVILGIEDLGDGLGHSLFLGGLQVLAAGEQVHIHGLDGSCVPQAQGVGVVGVVTGDHHVAGNGQNLGGILVDDVQVAVGPELTQGAAEGDLHGFLGLGQQPGGAQILPVVGHLDLLAFHDLLAEDTQLIADGIAGGGDLQRGHGVQIAGSQTAQTAVAEAGVRLDLENVGGLEAQVLQGFLHLGQDVQVVSVLHQAAAHQELQRQVMNLLLLLAAGSLLGFNTAQGHHVSDNQSAGLHHFFVGCLIRSLAEVQHQLAGESLF